MDTAHAPAEGSIHEYKIELNKTTGTWSYFDDGTVWQTYADAFWTGTLGTSIQWTGEIYNMEDDMPGTAGDKCSFTGCQYRIDGGAAYVDAGLVAGDVNSDDVNEWGAEWVSSTALNIWDKRPHP